MCIFVRLYPITKPIV